MFFVSGITGQVGGAAARQLLEGGRTVRTLARDPLKAAEWSRAGLTSGCPAASRSPARSPPPKSSRKRDKPERVSEYGSQPGSD